MGMPKRTTSSALKRIRAINSVGKIAYKPAKLLKGYQPKKKNCTTTRKTTRRVKRGGTRW